MSQRLMMEIHDGRAGYVLEVEMRGGAESQAHQCHGQLTMTAHYGDGRTEEHPAPPICEECRMRRETLRATPHVDELFRGMRLRYEAFLSAIAPGPDGPGPQGPELEQLEARHLSEQIRPWFQLTREGIDPNDVGYLLRTGPWERAYAEKLTQRLHSMCLFATPGVAQELLRVLSQMKAKEVEAIAETKLATSARRSKDRPTLAQRRTLAALAAGERISVALGMVGNSGGVHRGSAAALARRRWVDIVDGDLVLSDAGRAALETER